MEGGAFLGEGSYGCTFTPAIPCDTESVIPNAKAAKAAKPSKLTKVFQNEKDVTEEWKFAKLLAKVDPEQLYFIYPKERCDIPRKKIEKQPNADKCNLVHQSPKPSFPALQMKFGGITLEQFVQRRPSDMELMHILRHVLRGIQKLHQFGYLHQDLKLDNILVDATGVPHIIDYSLLTPVKQAFDPRVNGYLRSQYWLHPPEYRIEADHMDTIGVNPEMGDLAIYINAILTDLRSSMNFKLRTTDSGLLQEFIFAWIPYCEYYGMLRDYLQGLLHQYARAGHRAVLEMQQRHAKKVDIYSLGITFMNLMYSVQTKGDERIKKLLLFMMHPDPRKRYSATTAIRKLNEILQ